MSAKTFTPEQAAEVVRRYNNGESSERIAKDIFPDRKINSKTVVNCLRYMGVEVRASASALNPVITPAMRAGIIEMAAADGGYAGAMAHYGVSHETVRRYLREVGIDLPRGRKRTYDIDDHAFDVLTPETLYWIGFLWADGNSHTEVDRSGGRLTCALKEDDAGHLAKLRDHLSSTHPFFRDARPNKYDPEGKHPRMRYSVRAKGLCAALERHGFTVKRERVPDAALVSRHFFRGLIDGDGWLGTSKDGYPFVSCSGQLPVVECFRDYLLSQGFNHYNPYFHDGVWVVGTTGEPAVKIMRLLWEGATVVLDRKYARVREVL